MKKKDHGKMAYLDDPTRYVFKYLFIFIFDLCYSEEPPEFDESDIGTRDPALKATYEDLVNIRYVYNDNILFHNESNRIIFIELHECILGQNNLAMVSLVTASCLKQILESIKRIIYLL